MSKHLLDTHAAPVVVTDREPEIERQQAHPCTPESVASALAQQRAERREVLDRLGPGWAFTPGGQLVREGALVRGLGLSPFALTEDVLVGLRLGNFCWWAINGTATTN